MLENSNLSFSAVEREPTKVVKAVSNAGVDAIQSDT